MTPGKLIQSEKVQNPNSRLDGSKAIVETIGRFHIKPFVEHLF